MTALIATVEQLLKDAAHTLRRSLETYWPTVGDTGVLEANITLHVARAMWRSHGFGGAKHIEPFSDRFTPHLAGNYEI